MKIQAFIFDMDGVMLDSEPLQLECYNKVLNENNVSSLTMDEFKTHYIGKRDTFISELIVNDFHLSISSTDLVNKKREHYLLMLQQGLAKPMEGLIEVINQLHKQIPLAIASSSQVKEIELITKQFDIYEKFQVIMSAQDVPNGKPAPDVYFKTAELLNLSPDVCGVIEDTPTGIKAAKAAGMKCVGFTFAHTQDELSEADIIISTLSELLQAIENI